MIIIVCLVYVQCEGSVIVENKKTGGNQNRPPRH